MEFLKGGLAILRSSVFLWTDRGGGHVCRGSRRSVYWPYSSSRQSYTKNTLLEKNFPKFHGLITVAKKQLKKERKLSKRFFSNPTLSNVQNVQLLRAEARHVVIQQKRNSWRHFCNKLNSKTQTQKVWIAVRKIKGKGGCNYINHLKVNGNFITDKTEVAEVLAKNRSKYSSTDNYSDEFQRIKMLKEKRRLDFSSKNEEEYNLPFSVTELRQSLQRFSHRFGPGPLPTFNTPPKFCSIRPFKGYITTCGNLAVFRHRGVRQ